MAVVESAPSGRVRIRLEGFETELLRQLLGEMRTLLEADVPPSDAVLKRLYPDAFDDEASARAYRELIGDELENRKLAALRTAEETLGADGNVDATLDEGQIDRWLALLTDIRLAIGVRLDVTEEKMSAEVDADDPEAPALSVLHWLGWLQESILAEITT